MSKLMKITIEEATKLVVGKAHEQGQRIEEVLKSQGLDDDQRTQWWEDFYHRRWSVLEKQYVIDLLAPI